VKQFDSMVIILMFLVSCGGSKSEEGTSAGETTTAEEVTKRVFFRYPNDGARVTSPLIVEMGVEGMEIEPAGEVKEGKGHHHLIIDGSFIEAGRPVPVNETHIHYAEGQTKAELNLEPGKHTLTIQFGNGVHASYGEEMSATIEIEIVNE